MDFLAVDFRFFFLSGEAERGLFRSFRRRSAASLSWRLETFLLSDFFFDFLAGEYESPRSGVVDFWWRVSDRPRFLELLDDDFLLFDFFLRPPIVMF